MSSTTLAIRTEFIDSGDPVYDDVEAGTARR